MQSRDRLLPFVASSRLPGNGEAMMARWGKERVEEVILGRPTLFFSLFFSSCSLLMSRTRPQSRMRRLMVLSSTSGLLFNWGKLTLSLVVARWPSSGVAENVAWLLAEGDRWDVGLVRIGEGGEENMWGGRFPQMRGARGELE